MSAFGVDHGHVAKSLHSSSSGDDKTNRKLAAVGLGASGVATVGGLHALKATGSENRERKAALIAAVKKPTLASRIHPVKAKAPSKAAANLARKIGPARAAAVLGAGWLGLHGVELAGDTLAMHAQARELRRKGGGS